ncbi:hypothetical protein AB0C38_18690 [Amycolatopsis sp. NPDC048633]|uniref:hypothetical protein n=1 Tax=Amycolatopsis sp. NPDC048633 TaxID=3157095 RepID=UPI0033E029F0
MGNRRTRTERQATTRSADFPRPGEAASVKPDLRKTQEPKAHQHPRLQAAPDKRRSSDHSAERSPPVQPTEPAPQPDGIPAAPTVPARSHDQRCPATPLPLVLAVYLLFGVFLGTVNPPITTTAVSGMPASMAGRRVVAALGAGVLALALLSAGRRVAVTATQAALFAEVEGVSLRRPTG